MSALLLTRLAAATLAFTVLAGLLMLGRRHLRARIGAEAAYALWLAVPIGVLLCGWPVHRVLVAASLPALPAAPFTPLAALAPVSAHDTSHASQWVLAAWLLGASASALSFWLRQRALQRALGPLRRLDNEAHADACLSGRADLGPMLVGLPRPRIVLPADFVERYTPDEQAAILAHERTHRRRGDLWWNALAVLLRCVFWCHPLAGLAQRRFLADQELACDSAVLRAGGHAPRTYAGALLKSQLGPAMPLACSMLTGSPIHERILNLQRAPAPQWVRRTTALVVLGLAAAGARLAWSASLEVMPAPVHAAGTADVLAVTTELSIDGGPARHDRRTIAGALHLDGLRDGDGRACSAELIPHLLARDVVDVRLQLVCDGQPAASPRLLTHLGQAATLALGVTRRQPDGSFVTTRGFRLTLRFDPV
jgi:beta-lactamase regulating signal transducer with metallopeptidase domain